MSIFTSRKISGFVSKAQNRIESPFIRRVRKIANRRGVAVHFDARHGKGSHGRLYYGDRFTTVKNRKKEIGPGLLRKMLADLGLSIADIEE